MRITQSIREIPKIEALYYINQNDEIVYNSICDSCANECKQSYRTALVACPKLIKVKTKQEYIDAIEKQKKTIKEVANAIKINTRTLLSVLNNSNKDIPYDIHKKLMFELFNDDIEKAKTKYREKKKKK